MIDPINSKIDRGENTGAQWVRLHFSIPELGLQLCDF